MAIPTTIVDLRLAGADMPMSSKAQGCTRSSARDVGSTIGVGPQPRNARIPEQSKEDTAPCGSRTLIASRTDLTVVWGG